MQPDGLTLEWTPPWRFGWYDMRAVPDALYYTVSFNWTSLQAGDPRGQVGAGHENRTRHNMTNGPTATQEIRFGGRAIQIDYSQRTPKEPALGADVVVKLLSGAVGAGMTGTFFKEASKPGTPLEKARSVEEAWVA